MRRLFLVGVVVVTAVTGAGMPQAQTPATNQRLWTGTWEEHDSWEGHSKYGYSRAHISFVYVQGQTESGTPRWDSRQLTWSAVWEEHSFDYLVVQEVGARDERGTIQNRYSTDSVTLCEGGGTLELGPAVAGFGDDATPEQKAQLRARCVTTYQPRDAAVPTPPPSLSQRDALPVPGMPNDDDLTGCSYETSWPKGGRPAGSFSVSVSAPLPAVMEVDPQGDYGRFVPVPGDTLTFVASVPSGTARFRFELDREATSHFPGYASNANVDDVFFVKYNLGNLRGGYANDGPDLIFDAERFGGQEWSRIEPLVVETRTAQSAAVVTVTAMDYGAVGTLRAFVRSEDCGDWQPVPIRMGAETRDAVAIPMDEDANLMADALEDYRGRQSGADDDTEPKGNGMAGDGLTVFEEYRGFVIRGAECVDPNPPRDPRMPEPEPFPGEAPPPSFLPGWGDEHIRTTPRHKNLFIHTPDPELVAMLDAFAWSSGLSVHAICEPHYAGNDSRVVNFTLQLSGQRSWRGRTLSQADPQHGILLVPVMETQTGSLGVVLPVSLGMSGPPKFTSVVEIQKSATSSGRGFPVVQAVENRRRAALTADLLRVVVHELGHAVGVPHHGNRVDEWRDVPGRWNVTPEFSPRQRAGGPVDLSRDLSVADIPARLLVEPGPECRETDDTAAFMNGRFMGCLAARIVRRGQQNSGEMDCPMRYAFGDWYEPPNSTAVYLYPGFVTLTARPTLADVLIKVDAWGGRLLRYRNDLDRDPRSKLCTNIRGTGINGHRDDMNHAGDVGGEKPCVDYLVVNDLAARGVR